MEDKVKQFVLTTLKDRMNLYINMDEITDGTHLGPGGLDLESLEFVELMIILEKEFDISIPDEDGEEIAQFTLGDLTRYVADKVPATS